MKKNKHLMMMIFLPLLLLSVVNKDLVKLKVGVCLTTPEETVEVFTNEEEFAEVYIINNEVKISIYNLDIFNKECFISGSSDLLDNLRYKKSEIELNGGKVSNIKAFEKGYYFIGEIGNEKKVVFSKKLPKNKLISLYSPVENEESACSIIRETTSNIKICRGR